MLAVFLLQKLGKKKRKTRVVADKWKPDFFDLVEVVKTVMEGREYRSQYPYTNPDFAVTHACKIIAGRSEDSKKRVMEFIDKGWGNRENFVAKVFAHIEKEIAEAKPVRKNAKQD